MSTETSTRPTDDELRALRPSSIEIYEDNSGGLYLLIHRDDDGPAILLSGMERGEDALTDCRLLADWIDDVPERDRWYLRDEPVDDLTLVAVYRDDRLGVCHDALGRAAERYLGDQVMTIEVQDFVRSLYTGRNLQPGTYRLSIPAGYDPDRVTPEDAVEDTDITILGEEA